MAVSCNVKVVPQARLRKVRRLHMPGDVLVKVGDMVGPETILAKTDYIRGNPRILDLNSEFRVHVTPDMVDKVMLKKIGDVVTGQEPIARYQKSFWSEIIEVKAPCDGTIEHISRTQGRVIIREDPRSSKPVCICQAAKRLDVWPWMLRMFTEVKEGDFVHEGQVLAAALQNSLIGDTTMDYVYAPMSGVIEKICTKTGTITIVRPIKPARVLAHMAGMVTEVVPSEGAVIESNGAYLEGVFGIGGERFGELVVSVDGPLDALDEQGVTRLADAMGVAGEIREGDSGGLKGKIVLAGSIVTLEALRRLRDYGAAGLIVGGMNNLDLVQFLGREINVGITGHEDTGLTVVIMEGFGRVPMGESTWDLLSSMAGRVASIDGTTQIRAGAIRPQILFSHGTPPSDYADYGVGAVTPPGNRPTVGDVYGEPREEDLHPLTNLAPGDRVRCVRAPYFGLWGVVVEVPSEPCKVDSEAMMEVARVRLDSGETVLVAEANLEVFRDVSGFSKTS